MRSGDRVGVALAELLALDAPGDDPLGVDPDQRTVAVDRLRTAAYLDTPRPPGVGAEEIVYDYGGPAAALRVAELLGLGESIPPTSIASCSVLKVQPTGTTWGVPSLPTVAMRPRRRSLR
jgi:hypothetical protein